MNSLHSIIQLNEMNSNVAKSWSVALNDPKSWGKQGLLVFNKQKTILVKIRIEPIPSSTLLIDMRLAASSYSLFGNYPIFIL